MNRWIDPRSGDNQIRIQQAIYFTVIRYVESSFKLCIFTFLDAAEPCLLKPSASYFSNECSHIPDTVSIAHPLH